MEHCISETHSRIVKRKKIRFYKAVNISYKSPSESLEEIWKAEMVINQKTFYIVVTDFHYNKKKSL
jgi:hypothetical protein